MGAALALGAAVGLWVGDAALLASTHGGGAKLRQCVEGMGAAFLVATTTAAVVGAIAGAIFVPQVVRAAAAVRAWWRPNAAGDEGGRVVAGVVLTFAVMLAVWGEVTYHLLLWLLFEFARPDTLIFAITVSHALFAASFVLAWAPASRAARAALDAAWRVRGLRWVLSRTWPVPAAMAAAAALAFGVLGYHYRVEIGALPWMSASPVVVAALGVAVAAVLLSSRGAPAEGLRARLGRVALAVIALGVVAGGVAGHAIRPESTSTRTVAFERALSGRVGMAAWTFALDFDRDGQLNVLGGGDCAPFDRKRHTGAIDIPNNGIDEDCDGHDLSTVALRPRGREGVPRAGISDRPTVVLITVDALGAPRLQTFGSPTALMPNVDRFAATSMAFSACFSQGPSTRLSFPSMFTSRYDSQLEFTYAPRIPYSIAEKERQVQNTFGDAGYDTVAVIPTGYFDRARWPSVTRGFQRVDMSAMSGGKHNAAQVTDAALRVLSEPRQRPLYMWVHYFDAHPPYLPLPGVKYAERSDKSYYEAELRHIDGEVVRLLDAATHRSSPTYVIFTADHSTVFHPNPASRQFHYGYDLYTATLHVPLLVHGPGIRPGRVDDVVSTMDIVPTLDDLLREPDRAVIEGTSLLPELLAGRRDPKRVLFHEFFLPEFAYRGKDPLDKVSTRDDKYNLVLNRSEGSYELYDWRADYYEMHDLYEDMAGSPEVAHLRSLLAAFVGEFDRAPGSPVDSAGQHKLEL